MNLGWMTKPAVLILGPVLVSLVVWSIPGGESYALRGFTVRSDLTFSSFAVLLTWYVACLAVFVAGSKVGASIEPSRGVSEVENTPVFERRFLAVLTVLSTLGVGYAVVTAASQVSIVDALTTGGGNALNEALGGELGPLTLRYTAAIAAPVAIVLARRGVASWATAAYNVVLLLLSSSFSSRLSLILAAVVLVVLTARIDGGLRVSRKVVVGGLVVGYIALSLLNFSRNSQFYEANGVTSITAMNNYQFAAYLGAPAQVSIGVSDALLTSDYFVGSTSPAYLAAVPTFLQPGDVNVVGERMAGYGGDVDVARSLTTNSAFADVVTNYGLLGTLFALIPLLVVGVVWGHAMRYNGLVVVAAGVVSYGLAELWRIYLFPQGIFVYLLLATLIAAVLASSAARTAASHESRRVSIRTDRAGGPRDVGPSPASRTD
ncbi:hypothetical protein [Aeromicrobium alkaliterrae]|uniref:Oligosaccharide repeat unit polymerase n=1 Tax=Aeromicrobium alkaliterrae TaxID=302168 RepID=A0ABN2JZZ8_9ACTN